MQTMSRPYSALRQSRRERRELEEGHGDSGGEGTDACEMQSERSVPRAARNRAVDEASTNSYLISLG